MKLFSPILIALTLLIHAAQTQATTWSSTFECFVQIHYTQLAYGKTVKHVMAHVGVEQQIRPTWMGGSDQTEWADVQDVHLQLQDHAFLGQAILKGTTGKVGPYFKNFVIQYWVNYADGTSSISPIYPITVRDVQRAQSWEEYEKLRAAIMEESSVQPFWESTSCQQIEKISLG